MIDDIVISYDEEDEIYIDEEVFLLHKEGVWKVCKGDEDSLILEDPKNEVFFTEEIEYEGVLITPEILEDAKELLDEEKEK